MHIPRFPWPDQLLKGPFQAWVKEVSSFEGIPESLRVEVRRQENLSDWKPADILSWRAREFARYSDITDVIGRPSISSEMAELACALLSPSGLDPSRDCVHCLQRFESGGLLQTHLQRNCPYFRPFSG